MTRRTRAPGLGRLRLLGRLIAQDRWLFIGDLLVGAVFFILNLVPGLALREFLNTLDSPDPVTSALVLALVAYVAFKLANAVMAAAWMAVDTVFRYRIYTRLRTVLMTRLLSRPGAIGLPVPTGDALSRFRDDAVDTAEVLGKRGVQLVTSSVVLTSGSLVVMFSINTRVTLLAVLPTLGVAVVTFLASNQVKRLRAQNRQAAGEVSALLREVFSGIEAIKLGGAAANVSDRVREINHVRRRAAVRDGAFAGLLASAQGAVIVIGTGLIMMVAAASMRADSFGVGDLALFVYSLASLGTLVNAVGQFISQYQRFDVTRERLAALTPRGSDEDLVTVPRPDDEHSVAEPGHLVRPHRGAEPLRVLSIRGLDHDHPDTSPGLRDINLDIRRGQVVVVCGRLGSGKSTLLRAVLGLLPRTRGDVLWNATTIPPGTSLQPPLAAYTPQAPKAFSESLRENVLLGTPDDDRLERVLQTSTLDRDIDRFPDGADTQIGPRGHRMSGGQLHRLAAARMLARQAELYVIDDLSAALDNRTEATLWTRLVDDHRGRTMLVVSNRPAVLRRADHVVVMSAGRIVHQGPLHPTAQESADLRGMLGE